MAEHIICLTVDTDPDGLNSKVRNRICLGWDGLELLLKTYEFLPLKVECQQIPMTWFIRLDGQLEMAFGTPLYLWEQFSEFWEKAIIRGHELAWHPHLYRQDSLDQEPQLILEDNEACDELERLWSFQVQVPASINSFRNGEAWIVPKIINLIERIGLSVDSTAIPGYVGPKGHPANWELAPNEPYFPTVIDVCSPGAERKIIEIPMNSWLLKAPYDTEAKIRYMNPAVHMDIFKETLASWGKHGGGGAEDLFLWCFIFHPDEVMPGQPSNPLFAHSLETLGANLRLFIKKLVESGHSYSFRTISQAARLWRKKRQI